MRLMALLDINTALLHTDTISFSRRRPGASEKKLLVERTRRYDDIILPELSVVCAWVIVMKMVYGLDGVTRSVMAWDSCGEANRRQALLPGEPAAGLPTGESYIAELKQRLASGALRGQRVLLEKQFV